MWTMNLMTLDMSKECIFFSLPYCTSASCLDMVLLSWKQTHDLKLDLLHVRYSLTSEQWKKRNSEISNYHHSACLSGHDDVIQVWPIQLGAFSSVNKRAWNKSQFLSHQKGCSNILSHLIFIIFLINWCFQLLTLLH